MLLASTTHSKLFSIALLIGLTTAMAVIAVAPFQVSAGLRGEVAAGNALLAGLVRREEAAQSAPGQHHSAMAAARQSAALLRAATTGLAGAALQKLLIKLVRETGGETSSVQVLRARPDGDLLQIAINLSINTDIKGLRDFLYELETGTPLLFVDDVTLRRPGAQAGTTRRPKRRDLQVIMKISGYMRKEGGS